MMLKCVGRVYLISSPIATEGFFLPLRLPGGPQDQSDDDGVGLHYGGLPAAGQQGQFLPHGRVQRGRHALRHRLRHRRDRETGKRLIKVP